MKDVRFAEPQLRASSFFVDFVISSSSKKKKRRRSEQAAAFRKSFTAAAGTAARSSVDFGGGGGGDGVSKPAAAPFFASLPRCKTPRTARPAPVGATIIDVNESYCS